MLLMPLTDGVYPMSVSSSVSRTKKSNTEDDDVVFVNSFKPRRLQARRTLD
jgi:hypothetical protein